MHPPDQPGRVQPGQSNFAFPEHWYQHRPRWRTSSATAASVPPSGTCHPGYPQVNLAWIAPGCAAGREYVAAWLHQLTAATRGGDILAGHGVRVAWSPRLARGRRRLMAVPRPKTGPPRPPPDPAAAARQRPAPPRSWPSCRALPAPRLTCTPQAPGSPSSPTAPPARPQESPQIANPAQLPEPSASPLPGILAHQDHLRGSDQLRRYSRNRD